MTSGNSIETDREVAAPPDPVESPTRRRWHRMGRFQRRERDWDRVAVGAILLGAVLRIVWILIVHPPVRYIYSDMLGYVQRAERLASHSPLIPSDAFFPPGTHMLLAIPIALFGTGVGLWVAAVLWCALSVVTVYVSWRLTRELLTPAAAALTAVLCAVWPLFITFGGYFTSETPALALLIAALWAGVAATRREGGTAVNLALLAGVLGGAAAAVRPQLLINVAILALLVLVTSRRRFALASCVAAGLVAALLPVLVYNSIATGQPTGLATNGGLNFWFGHCEARQVTTSDAQFGHPVPGQAGRPGVYVFANHGAGDEAFFTELGWRCIEQDGFAHVLRLGRNVLDMTATTIPWPQSGVPGGTRDVVQVVNVIYSVLLPWILIESVGLALRRRRAGERSSEAFLLLNLACVAVVAILVLGDPRVRAVYDVFGFALLSTLLVERFHLDRPAEPARSEIDA